MIAALVVLPVVSVVILALSPGEGVWKHLIATALPRYFFNTVILMVSVGALAAVIGVISAWLVTMYRFPLSRFLEFVLFFPLALPAYVGAYALVDFLEFAGPVQSGLRSLFGWELASEYYFPEIRSVPGAVFVMTAALYPYVYLLARTAFREQSKSVLEVSRTLGAGSVVRFARVGLPMIRPSVAAGVAIVMMETVGEFGVVEYLAVQTLTTGIFSVWLQGYNIAGASQIACTILLLVLLLVALEKYSRRRIKFYRLFTGSGSEFQINLTGFRAIAATVWCLFPVAFGFILPVGVMLVHTIRNLSEWLDPDLVEALYNTLLTGGFASAITVSGAILLVYGVRLAAGSLPAIILPITAIGYAAPGAVLGIGLLIPMAAADHAIADLSVHFFGYDPGLILTGSALAVIVAYSVRFFAIAQGTTNVAMGRIEPALPIASRSLGRTAFGTLRDVHLPLLKGSLLTALLLVFVDCVKELPATLLLRPFDFNTLATRVYERASLENLGEAAPAALLVAAVGLLGVVLLARTNR